MLVGLVTKNGILIVELPNQLWEQGMDKFEAAINAAKPGWDLSWWPLCYGFGAAPIAFALEEQRVPAENQWALQ